MKTPKTYNEWCDLFYSKPWFKAKVQKDNPLLLSVSTSIKDLNFESMISSSENTLSKLRDGEHIWKLLEKLNWRKTNRGVRTDSYGQSVFKQISDKMGVTERSVRNKVAFFLVAQATGGYIEGLSQDHYLSLYQSWWSRIITEDQAKSLLRMSAKNRWSGKKIREELSKSCHELKIVHRFPQ